MACADNLLNKVKVACRVASDAYDDELMDLIQSAIADMGITDIAPEALSGSFSPLIETAIKTYCRINHPYDGMDDATMARLKASYDEQKAQLLMSSEYTDWGDGDA